MSTDAHDHETDGGERTPDADETSGGSELSPGATLDDDRDDAEPNEPA
jgi:hypothetical protein